MTGNGELHKGTKWLEKNKSKVSTLYKREIMKKRRGFLRKRANNFHYLFPSVLDGLLRFKLQL